MDRSTHHRSRRSLVLPALAAVTLWLAACTQGPTPSFTITLSPAAVELLLGGDGVQVQVTLTRSGGASADVTLGLSSPPSGVTGDFAPAVLSGATLVSTLTLSASGAADEDTFVLTVSASGDGLSDSAEIEIEVTSLTVNGTAIGIFGEPLENLTAYIAGRPPVTTAADGSFTISGVVAPYDLTLARGTVWANTLMGLTTPTPTVQSFLAATDAPLVPSATIEGNLTGALSPVPAGTTIVICPEGIEFTVWAVNGCVSHIEGDTSYQITVVWTEATASADVRLRAYAYSTDMDDVVTGVIGSGTVLLNDVAEGLTTVADLSVGNTPPASLVTVDLSVTGPPGLDVSATLVSHPNERSSNRAAGSMLLSSPLELMIPFISGATHTVVVNALDPDNAQSIAWRTGVTNGSSVAIDLAVPPAAVSPANGATGVTATTLFAMGNPAGGAVHVYISRLTGGQSIMVSTVDDSLLLPDLSEIGFELTPGAQYNWGALATPHISSPDDMVTDRGYLGPYLEVFQALSGGPAPTADGSMLTAGNRLFEVAP